MDVIEKKIKLKIRGLWFLQIVVKQISFLVQSELYLLLCLPYLAVNYYCHVNCCKDLTCPPSEGQYMKRLKMWNNNWIPFAQWRFVCWTVAGRILDRVPVDPDKIAFSKSREHFWQTLWLFDLLYFWLRVVCSLPILRISCYQSLKAQPCDRFDFPLSTFGVRLPLSVATQVCWEIILYWITFERAQHCLVNCGQGSSWLTVLFWGPGARHPWQ